MKRVVSDVGESSGDSDGGEPVGIKRLRGLEQEDAVLSDDDLTSEEGGEDESEEDESETESESASEYGDLMPVRQDERDPAEDDPMPLIPVAEVCLFQIVKKVLSYPLDPIAFMLLQATGQAMNRFFTNQMEKQKFDVPNGEMDIKIVRDRVDGKTVVEFSFSYWTDHDGHCEISHNFKDFKEMSHQLMAFRYFRFKRLSIECRPRDSAVFQAIWDFIEESKIVFKDFICRAPRHPDFMQDIVELAKVENLKFVALPGLELNSFIFRNMCRSLFIDLADPVQFCTLTTNPYYASNDLTIYTPFALVKTEAEVALRAFLKPIADLDAPIDRMFAWHSSEIPVAWMKEFFHLNNPYLHGYFVKIDFVSIPLNGLLILAEKPNGVMVNIFCQLDKTNHQALECERIAITQESFDEDEPYSPEPRRWGTWVA